MHLFPFKIKANYVLLDVPLAAFYWLEEDGSAGVTGHLQILRDFPFI